MRSQCGRIFTAIAVSMGLSAGIGDAAEATPAQILSIKPAQPGVQCDTPAADTFDKCKVEVVQKPGSGYQLTDSRGLIVRRILDTNGDGNFDQWSFYMNGQEVYRDFDTKNTGKPNNFRWFNSGGSRWGVDDNGDGKIDHWKSISAEEASAEAVAAMLVGDFDRIKLVMLSDDDVKTLGVDEGSIGRAKKAQEGYSARFQQVAAELPKTATWTRLDKQNPMTIPATDARGQDLVLYANATIIAEVENQPRYLRTTEIVKVGDVWKLTDIPAVMDPNKPSTAVAVLMATVEPANGGNAANNNPAMQNVENKPEIQELVTRLEKHDQKLANIGEDAKQLAAYHKERQLICADIAAKSTGKTNRLHWYKQAADSLNAAVQTGEYKEGVALLGQYADEFAKVEWGKDVLAPYFKYRALNAALGMELQGNADGHEKAQAAFLAQVQAFVEAFPNSEDAPEALWQLGNSFELSAKEADAAKQYQRIVTDFPKNKMAAKATGALRRIDSVGKPFEMTGINLMAGGPLEASQFRGKYLIVSYWATFCEPCKAEMPRLEKLRQKLADKNLEVLGVCLDQNKASGQQFIKDKGYTFPQLHEEGSLDSPPAVQYGIISLPYLMIVDPSGTIVKKNAQFGQLESDLESLMARKLTSQPGAGNRKE